MAVIFKYAQIYYGKMGDLIRINEFNAVRAKW